MTAEARTVQVTEFKKEADLCDLFISEFSRLDGWTCYPEAGGFDVLVVHDDGRQIGVEAKLSLNAKVAEQILPHSKDDFFGKPGPDHRMVIVSRITDASAGIARMLEMLGVKVLVPRLSTMRQGDPYTFDILHHLLEAQRRTASYGAQYLFDWNPAQRCHVPSVLQDLPAGVPAPVMITPWKEAALRVVALMRHQGFITSKQIAAHGIGASVWIQSQGSEPAWLAKGAMRGRWIETKHMPPFDKQHPQLYELAVREIEEEVNKAFTLC